MSWVFISSCPFVWRTAAEICEMIRTEYASKLNEWMVERKKSKFKQEQEIGNCPMNKDIPTYWFLTRGLVVHTHIYLTAAAAAATADSFLLLGPTANKKEKGPDKEKPVFAPYCRHWFWFLRSCLLSRICQIQPLSALACWKALGVDRQVETNAPCAPFKVILLRDEYTPNRHMQICLCQSFSKIAVRLYRDRQKEKAWINCYRIRKVFL